MHMLSPELHQYPHLLTAPDHGMILLNKVKFDIHGGVQLLQALLGLDYICSGYHVIVVSMSDQHNCAVPFTNYIPLRRILHEILR